MRDITTQKEIENAIFPSKMKIFNTKTPEIMWDVILHRNRNQHRRDDRDDDRGWGKKIVTTVTGKQKTEKDGS